MWTPLYRPNDLDRRTNCSAFGWTADGEPALSGQMPADSHTAQRLAKRVAMISGPKLVNRVLRSQLTSERRSIKIFFNF